MTLVASVWVDAQSANVPVQAWIGDTLCATSNSGTTPDAYASLLSFHIPSAAAVAGCGTEGTAIRFVVDGRPANDTIAWAPGPYADIHATIVAGPPFERVAGTYWPSLAPGERIEAVIDGTPCSIELLRGPTGDDRVFYLALLPEDLGPGCGRAGATFRIESVDTSAATPTVIGISTETYAWEPGSERVLDVTLR